MLPSSKALSFLDSLDTIVANDGEEAILRLRKLAQLAKRHWGAEHLALAWDDGDVWRVADSDMSHSAASLFPSAAEMLSLAQNPSQGWVATSWDGWHLAPLYFRTQAATGQQNQRLGAMAWYGESTLSNDEQKFISQRLSSALHILMSQERLRERTLELATVYEIDRIRDQKLDFAEMLQKIMHRVLSLLPASLAAIALRPLFAPLSHLQLHGSRRDGRDGRAACVDEAMMQALQPFLEPVVLDSFQKSQMTVKKVKIPTLLMQLNDFDQYQEAKNSTSTQSEQTQEHEMMCVPLMLDEEVLGAFLLVSPAGQTFSRSDQRLLQAVCSQTDTAIFEDLKRQRVKEAFKKYVSRDVFTEILRSNDDLLKGRRTEVTCFFSDLRSFTSVSEQLDVDTVVGMLNEHLEEMTKVVFAYGGTVDKFIGDCVMAFFGAPLAQPDHAHRAVLAARAMRARQQEIAASWAHRGLPPVLIGIGLHSGEVFVGNIGGESLASYTIIGDNVNLASRLEGVSGPDEIIISGATLARLPKDHGLLVETRGDIIVKGKTIAVPIYNVR